MEQNKTDGNKIKILTRKEKDALRQMGETLLKEHDSILKRYKKLETAYTSLATDLVNAYDTEVNDGDDIAEKAKNRRIDTIKAKMAVVKDELERLSKRENSISEEVASINKAIKDDFDAKTGAWTTVGAWLIGGASVVLSGWGLAKSHKAFEDGTMVDKPTRGLAERINALFNFFNFKRG